MPVFLSLLGLCIGINLDVFHIEGIMFLFIIRLYMCVMKLIACVPKCFMCIGAILSGPKAFEFLVVFIACVTCVAVSVIVCVCSFFICRFCCLFILFVILGVGFVNCLLNNCAISLSVFPVLLSNVIDLFGSFCFLCPLIPLIVRQ